MTVGAIRQILNFCESVAEIKVVSGNGEFTIEEVKEYGNFDGSKFVQVYISKKK